MITILSYIKASGYFLNITPWIRNFIADSIISDLKFLSPQCFSNLMSVLVHYRFSICSRTLISIKDYLDINYFAISRSELIPTILDVLLLNLTSNNDSSEEGHEFIKPKEQESFCSEDQQHFQTILKSLLIRCSHPQVLSSSRQSNIQMWCIHWVLKNRSTFWNNQTIFECPAMQAQLELFRAIPAERLVDDIFISRPALWKIILLLEDLKIAYNYEYCGPLYLPLTLNGTNIAIESVEPWEMITNSNDIGAYTQLRHEQIASHGWNLLIIKCTDLPPNYSQGESYCHTQDLLRKFLKKKIGGMYVKASALFPRNSWSNTINNLSKHHLEKYYKMEKSVLNSKINFYERF